MYDEMGLPRYLDMQAELGYTKHLGGAEATRRLMELCGVSADQTVLNVGSGAGNSSVYIARNYGCRVMGVDLKENMVTSARRLARRRGMTDQLEFRQADAQDLPFENDSFDILICESVNTFVPNKPQAVSEYVRVVRPGGVVGLDEPVWVQAPSAEVQALIQKAVGHEIRSPSFWEDLLREGGLTQITGETHPIGLRTESRNQMSFLSAGDLLRILGKMVTVFLGRDPYYRTIMRDSLGTTPAEVTEYMGYGLFVGQVGQGNGPVHK